MRWKRQTNTTPGIEGNAVKDSATEQAIAAVAGKTGAAGSIVALWGGWTATDIAAFGGLVVAVLGFAVNLYYRHKEDRRRDELHRVRLRELEEEDEV